MAPRAPLFPYPPQINSRESLDLALAELQRITAWEERVQREVTEKTTELTRGAAAELVVDVGADKPMALADWRTRLEEAAEKFCTKHRDELLEEGKQSLALNMGTVGWRKQKAALVPLDDFPAGGNPKLLDTLLATLRDKLLSIAKFFEKGSARFVELKLTWRKTELLKAAKDQEISMAELKKAGFELDDPGEKFFIDLEKTEVESQSAEKP